jgi:hypothetical protein
MVLLYHPAKPAKDHHLRSMYHQQHLSDDLKGTAAAFAAFPAASWHAYCTLRVLYYR